MVDHDLHCHRKPEALTSGFTLIELLIVVAIIAILAGIGISNYMESATRARVARVRNDMRVLAAALEGYVTDNNAYPPATGVGALSAAPSLANPVSHRLIPLTTPISYITAKPDDPLLPGDGFWGNSPYDTYDYLDAASILPRGCGLTSGAEWRLASAGPDGIQSCGGRTISEYSYNSQGVDYDPTNGTKSMGDVVRVGPPSTKGGVPADPANPNRRGNLRAPTYSEQWH